MTGTKNRLDKGFMNGKTARMGLFIKPVGIVRKRKFYEKQKVIGGFLCFKERKNYERFKIRMYNIIICCML